MPIGEQWSKDEDERLLRLWSDHQFTTGEIARWFTGRTRNACIGRLMRLRKRLGTEMVRSGQSVKAAGPKKKRVRRSHFNMCNDGGALAPPTPVKVPPAPPTARRLPLLELRSKDCRFIVTDHDTREHLYCAVDASAFADDAGNNCYCAFHQRLMRAH